MLRAARRDRRGRDRQRYACPCRDAWRCISGGRDVCCPSSMAKSRAVWPSDGEQRRPLSLEGTRNALRRIGADLRLTLSSGGALVRWTARVRRSSSNTSALDLAAAGITPGKRGLIPVDAHFRTRRSRTSTRRATCGRARARRHEHGAGALAMFHAFGATQKADLRRCCRRGSTRFPRSAWSADRGVGRTGRDYVVDARAMR